MDVVLETMGGDTFIRTFETLRKGSLMVTVVAFPNGEAQRYCVKVAGSFTTPSAGSLGEIAKLVEAGGVMPHIEAVFPLEDASEALALSEAGRARVMIVLNAAD